MKKYNFDEIIDRHNTNCIKYDALERVFGAKDIVPLWVADMDFRTPGFIVDAIRRRAEHEVFGYTFRPDSYFEAIISWMEQRHGWSIKKEWVSFSPGVVAALGFAMEAFSSPGDGVIVQPPVYFPFFDIVNGSARKLVENPLKIVNGRYTFDFDDLKSKIDTNTRLLLLCNPQNPGGTVWNREELTALVDICLENNIMIISDEIHSDLVYKGNKHIPLPTISEEAARNCMVCMAPSKTFNTAGFSTSIVIVPERKNWAKYERALNLGHAGMGNIFGTIALESAYKNGSEWVDQLIDYLWDNYLFLEGFIAMKLPKIKIMKPEATYLIWLDFSAYNLPEDELMKLMIEKVKIGLNNGSKFGTGGNGWLRMNIGCPKQVLEEALKNLYTVFSEL